MASEDLFQEDFSEEILPEIDNEIVEEVVDGELKEIVVSENKLVAESEDVIKIVTAANESSVLKEKPTNEPKLFNLPFARIRNLMKLDPDLHTASNEAVFCITKATELFIDSLAKESYSFTKKKTIQKRDVDLAITSVDSLMFLEGAMNF